METLTANLSAWVRSARWNGRDYLVAPVSMIVPGVLPGSRGPLYYPLDEIAANYGDWERVPLTVYHPADPLTGRHLSAADPGVLERQGIGFVRRPTAKGKLAGEAWFDVERTENHDRQLPAAVRILPRLHRGEKIEVSTGLYTSNVPAPDGYLDHRGNPYRGLIARRYVPDHLAVLPDQVGACSIKDGCGILVNSKPLSLRQDAAAVLVNGGFSPVRSGSARSAGRRAADGHMLTFNRRQGENFPAVVEVENWCNQHGGNTCKGGKKGGIPVAKAPTAKVGTKTAASKPGPAAPTTKDDPKSLRKEAAAKRAEAEKYQRRAADPSVKGISSYEAFAKRVADKATAEANDLERRAAAAEAKAPKKRTAASKPTAAAPMDMGRLAETTKSLKRHADSLAREVEIAGGRGEKVGTLKTRVRKARKEYEAAATELVKRGGSMNRWVPVANCPGMVGMSQPDLSVAIAGTPSVSGSLEDKISRVRRAFREEHPFEYDRTDGHQLESHHLVAMFDDYVICSHGGDYYRQEYVVKDDGEVRFTGGLKPVKQETNWVSV